MDKISTVIIAGGKGTRMGGAKGLQLLHERALIDWVLDAVRPYSDEIFINANEDPAAYARPGCEVIADHTPGRVGPLAGLQAALRFAKHDRVLTVPCDTPYLPDDLVPRLAEALDASGGEAAVAVAEGRRHPTVALYRKSVSAKLDGYLDADKRKVNGWLDTLQLNEVVFDDPDAFANINSEQELALANQRFDREK